VKTSGFILTKGISLFVRHIISILLVSICSTATALSADKTWVLYQTSDRMGKIIVHIHKDALKVEKPGFYTIVCSQPDWKVVFFNRQKRIISDLAFERFQRKGIYGDMMIFNSMPDLTTRKYIQKARSKFKGVTVVSCEFPTKNKKSKKNDTKFLIAPEITADAHVFRLLRRYLQEDMPTDCAVIEWRSHKGRPQFMQSEIGNHKRGLVEEVSTEDIKQIAYNPRDFACPSNFKRVAYTEITIGSKQDVIDDFLPSEPH